MLVTNKLPVQVFIESAESCRLVSEALMSLVSVLLSTVSQVIAGQGLDVSFALFSPSGRPLLSDVRRSDGIHMWIDILKGELNIKPDKIYFSVCFQYREKQNMSEITLIIVIKSSNQM